MSYLIAIPEMFVAAAADVAGIGSSLSAATAAAAAPTTAMAAAAGDEVSTAIASALSGYAQEYQALSAQAAAFHTRFVQALSGAGAAYVGAEAANSSPFQDLLDLIDAPANLLLHRPLIGDGADGAPGTGQAGGPGGILIGQWRCRRVGSARAGRWSGR